MGETTKRVMLREAVARAGMDQVSKRLNAPASQITAWVDGIATMPDRKFLTLVDIIDGMDDK